MNMSIGWVLTHFGLLFMMNGGGQAESLSAQSLDQSWIFGGGSESYLPPPFHWVLTSANGALAQY